MNVSTPVDALHEALQSATPVGPPAGYFGKVPSHGDFVCHRLDRCVRDGLDAWLSASLRASQARLGEAWLNAYLVAPLWRFAISAGVCGPQALMGVMMAGVDRVGRYFPLVLAAPLPDAGGGMSWACKHREWYEHVEDLVSSTLADDFALAAFDAAALRVHAPTPPTDDDPKAVGPHSMWWTVGSDTVEPFATACHGLPEPEDFHVFLTGDRSATGLRTIAFTPVRRADADTTAQRRAVTWEAGVATHAGTRNTLNTDATHVSPRGDLFALASGFGASAGARHAADLSAAALAEIGGTLSLSDLVAEVKGKLGQAHARVRALPPGGDAPQASVVALAVQGHRSAVAWVGDARMYLREGGMLRPVTRDHVEVGLTRQLVRAIGGPSPLAVQTATGTLRDDDAVLLCSRSLVEAVGERALVGALGETGAVEPQARRLVEDALIAGAPTSCTALVVRSRDTGS